MVLPSTTDDSTEFTGEQLALPTATRVRVLTPYGPITGARLRNGVSTFLNVPYAEPVPRWEDAQPLRKDFKYDDKEYIVDGMFCAQPRR